MKDTQTTSLWRKWSLLSTLLLEIYSYASRISVFKLHVRNHKLSMIGDSGPLTVLVMLDEKEKFFGSSYTKIDVSTKTSYGSSPFFERFKIDIKVGTMNILDLNNFFDRDSNPERWLILNLESKLDNIPNLSDSVFKLYSYISYKHQWKVTDIKLHLNHSLICSTPRTSIIE